MASSDLTEQIDGLVARVDGLESRAVLGGLANDYCRSFDAGDWPLFRSIWHDDAVWEPGGGAPPILGGGAIQAAADLDAWQKEGDEDAFRRMAARAGTPGGRVDAMLDQARGDEDDDDNVDVVDQHQKGARIPTTVGYEQLAPDIKRAMEYIR